MKIITLALLAIVLSLGLTRMRFFRRQSAGKYLALQLGMAVLVGAVTINLIVTHDGHMVFKYLVVGVGVVSCIAILGDVIMSRKEQRQDAKR